MGALRCESAREAPSLIRVPLRLHSRRSYWCWVSSVRDAAEHPDVVDPKWYESFFQGIALEMWRKAVSPEQTRLEVDFLERVLRLQAGFRVLDVPCGLGRHSLELASRGYRLASVDLSPQMIEEGRAAAIDAGLEIEWRNADMRDLSWKSEFDAGFCFGNSFGD